jgi:hypothetical protein
VIRLTAAITTALATAVAIGAGHAFAADPISKPDHVAPGCRARANSSACTIALRYLAALDLDRAREACSLLEPETLEAAGGMARCVKTLSAARGIRIRYSILDVHYSPFGRTVVFSTRAGSRAPIRQAMIVTRRGRILAIAPVP